ncbi:MAG: Mur ligase family protein, partial [Planctomycetota bacterium]
MITFKSKIDILNLTSCELVVKGYTGNVTNITFDSRKVPLNSIFFALKGEKTDGHNFVVDALHKGASVAIVDKVLPEYKNVTGKTIIKVDSSIKFMANLAKEYRKMINADVIGITGTIGKTTTKYLVGSILSKRFNTLVSQESYNNLLGVSYTLLNYENEEKVVLELGINRLHEIEELVEIAKPDFAIITYITPVHLEGMHSIFEIFTQKRKIVKYARKIFINADSFLLNSLAHPHIVKVGTAEDLDYRGFIVRNELNITHFTINNEFFHIPSYTKSILYPALFAYAIGKEYGLSYSEIFDT